jgi:type IV pilus assembly protein PilC
MRNSRLHIGMHDRILFARRLSLYLRAGIPIVEALGLIHDDAHGSLATLLQSLIQNISQGSPLSRALSYFPRIYKPFHIQLITIGEASGTLPDSLTHIAELLTKRSQLSRTLTSALVYPFLIGIGTLALSGLLIGYVFPKLTPLFRGLHTTLPFTTRVLISLSSLLSHHYLIILISFTALVVGLWYSLRIQAIQNLLDRLILSTPVLGSVAKSYFLAHIFHSLSLLLKSGVRLDAAISFVKDSTSQHLYKTSLAQIEMKILTGIKITDTMRTFPHLYSLTVIQLLTAGERTGTLSESAQSVSEIYEQSLTEQLQKMTVLIEPILMLTMGLIVGFVALAIITPMYALTQNLSTH